METGGPLGLSDQADYQEPIRAPILGEACLNKKRLAAAKKQHLRSSFGLYALAHAYTYVHTILHWLEFQPLS